ncbi:MAG: MoxR family ATPase [Nanoarchaeota archaeon]|nr:MoxR family ATPase [Nanoarchaeota archaeon]MBU1644625.1 MoxR family ATPase [Nanoarchaeota archaeon]MBU1976888.1 MoxR family ATPase [Nanoarchaeota archaeon]
MGYREKLQQTIDLIGEDYYIDPEEKKVGRQTILHWNTSLLVLSYVMNKNPLIIGEPGFAKTTSAKTISALMSGYPFDLYESAQIQGHPDQTFETMLARLDFSKLDKEEAVIWLSSAYLPVRIIDEIRRLPAGNQNELLNMLQTGRINYLNSTFYTGETPFFATANHQDEGSYILIPPLCDRFSIHVELGHIGAMYTGEIARAKKNIKELCDPKITNRILSIINDKEKSIEEKLETIEKERDSYRKFLEYELGVSLFDAEDRKNITEEISSIKVTNEAMIFLQMIDAELNYTPTFGRKRSSDKRDTNNHGANLASNNTKNAASPRAILEGIDDYAKAIVYLRGEKAVRKEHVFAVAPHALGHRLDFENEFKSKYANEKRPGHFGAPTEMFLAEKLVEGIEENYKKVKIDLDLLMSAYLISNAKEKNKIPELSLSIQQWARANDLLNNEDLVDHPLAKEYIRAIKRTRSRF